MTVSCAPSTTWARPSTSLAPPTPPHSTTTRRGEDIGVPSMPAIVAARRAGSTAVRHVAGRQRPMAGACPAAVDPGDGLRPPLLVPAKETVTMPLQRAPRKTDAGARVVPGPRATDLVARDD